MQKDIHYYEKLIQEKRKKTPFREFVREIASWSPLNYYKNNGCISIFPQTGRASPVISTDDFNKLRDSLYYLEFLVGTSLFEQISFLQKTVETPCVRQYGTYENSHFTDTNANVENCFLIRCSTTCRNVCYSLVVKKTENVYNSIKVQGGEGNVYSSYSIDGGFNIFYSKCIENSSNIWFCSDLISCYECLFCHKIQNQKYMIENVQYSETDYFIKKVELLKEKDNFEKYSFQVGGNNYKTINSENTENIFGGTHIINGRNGLIVGNPVGTKNIYDTLLTGTLGDYYGCADSGVNSEFIYCSLAIVNSTSIFYSQGLESCSFCLGCIGLKNKSYCIFNKQYTKEEWEEKACEIFASMEADGTLGDFFPASMNPFYFNDTLAYLIDDSFTREEVTKEGYLWRDEPIRADIPEGMKVVKNTELDQFQGWTSPQPSPKGEGALGSPSLKEKGSGDEVWYIDPEILNVVISDEKGNYYRIVKMEYDFLMKHGLPLPTMHWLERMKMGFR